MLKEAMRELTERKQTSKIVKVLWLCREGRHRSVACSYLSKWGIQHAGHLVVDEVHLQQDSWPRSLCRDCPKCSADDPDKAEVKQSNRKQ